MPMIIPVLAAGGAAAAGAAGGAATVGGFAGLIGITSATTGAIVNAAVGTALAVGASYVAAKLAPGPKQPKPSDGAIEFKQPLPPRFFTYGKVKISGPVLFLEMNDLTPSGWASNHRLLKIVAFGTRELAMMDPFYIDGTQIALSSGADGSDGTVHNWTQGGTERGNCWVYFGSDSQAAAALAMGFFSGWTSNHRLRGIPYTFSQFESADPGDFQEAFPNGESNFACVGGVKLYDPRKDSTNGGSGSHRINDKSTWEYSDNQRLCALDWIMWPEGYDNGFVAKGTPIASRTLANCRIDWASWIPQINLADEDVALRAGGTEKRYRIATRVGYDEPRSRVLHRIMQAGDQQLYTTAAGLIGSRGGKWTAPTVNLAVENMPEAHFTHGVPTLDRVNEFQLTAMLPSKDYTEYDLEPWPFTADPDHAAGIIRRAPLDLSQVPSNSQAQRLAKIYMSKQNPRWSGNVRTTFAGLDALGESAVNLSFAELDVPAGTFNGAFWVNGQVSFLPDRTGLTFPVASADPTAYDWTASEEQYLPGEDPGIVVTITAPADAATVSGTVTVSASATANFGVAGVTFKYGSTTIGAEDTSSPYSVSWDTTTLPTEGAYVLTATARDTHGNTQVSAPITVTVSFGMSVSITAPTAGASVSGNVTISATAAAAAGVAGVTFKVDGTTIGAEDTSSPYSVVWDSTGVTNGSHTLTAVLRDAAGHTLTSSSVSITVANAVAPVLSAAVAEDFCDIFLWAKATTDTASGTYYAVVVPAAATAPTGAQIEAGTDGSGNPATSSGNLAITATGAFRLLLRGLTAVTAYKVYLVHKTSIYSNVVNAAFTTDTLVASYATTGAATGLNPSTGTAALGTNIADPTGGTNAVRWTDNNDSATNQQVALATSSLTFFNGVNKFHLTVKHQGGAVHLRQISSAITVTTTSVYFNSSTGALGTTNPSWTPTPVIFDLGSGWKMFSGQINLAGADVTGTWNFNKGASDNSIVGITRNGTHVQDLYNIRITRV